MSETSEERGERRKSSGFNPLTSCHDDAAAHSIETVLNGSEETIGSHGLPGSHNNASLQGAGFSLHSFLYCDHSTSSANRVGRGGSSGSNSFFGLPSLSDYQGSHARNESCVEPEQKRWLEPCSSGNAVADVRQRQPNRRGSFGRSSSLSGCEEDLSAQQFLNGYLNSIDELRLRSLAPPVASRVSVDSSVRNVDAGEQTDAGYMDDGDAFVDYYDSSALHSSHSGGSGIHFAFDAEAGAAGGDGAGVEDFGDFIDTDIPRNRNSSSQFSSRSNDSVTSSFEELAVTAVNGASAEQAEDLSREFDRPRPDTMALQSTPRQQAKERALDFPVNNLNQVDQRRVAATGSSDDIMTTQNQSNMDSARMSDSMNFVAGVGRAKSWRWSDGDAVGNILPSMIAAVSQTSDSSYGTPSVPLVSPFSVEDEVLVSATSSPLTPSRLQGPGTLEFDPFTCSNNSEGSGRLFDDYMLLRNGSVRHPPVLEPNIESASSFSRINLLQNLNQATPKHLLEKNFGWEATSGSPSSVAAASKHSVNGAEAAVQGLQSEDCTDTACHRCRLEGRRTENELNGSELSDFTESSDGHFADRWPENVRLATNRRFSCQNLIVTDSLEFSDSGVSSTKGRGRSRNSDVMTLSDDSLFSTHFVRHPQPLSLHLSWHSNHDYLECSHLVKSSQNGDLIEMGVRPKDATAKKLSSETLFLSLSDDDDEDGEEGEAGHLRRHRNKNSRRHVRCREDKNLPRLTDGPSVTTSCGACLIIILLRHLGVTDVSHRVYELMHVNRSLDKASLPEYLLASSATGVNAETLVDRLAQLTENRIYGKFFHLFPQRNINLIHWLKYWIKKGAVPLATLKRETKVATSNDVWHHKIISTSSIQAVNDGMEASSEDNLSLIWLSSDSSIRISRHHIVSRWRDDCDLSILMSCTDTRWQEMNVLGQVVNILREERLQTVGSCRPQLTSHVVIPTHFKSGVTLYLRKDSAGYQELQSTKAELPLADCTGQDSVRKKTSLPHDKNQKKKRNKASGVKETAIF